jgi:hypothetical protein
VRDVPLLERLFRSKPKQAVLYPGSDRLDVVGESYHQGTLWGIVGDRNADEVWYETNALLMPESEDSEYPEAIRVLIDGKVVGSLSRYDAPVYRPGLLRLMSNNRQVALNATIVGGESGLLGVTLDHYPSDFGVTRQKAHQIAAQTGMVMNFRTGLSEAVETDREDERYDLSWFKEILENESTAIERLRAMLKTEHDPIDRHYMMCELEQRLYKRRDAFASALDEYDAVCCQHDQEMDTIRPALLDKFGVIPVVDMYRQSAVRWQKAKDWERARDWAERGVRVYGGDAARPEVVDDLRTRITHAVMKIEAVNQPKPKPKSKPRAIVTADSHPLSLETLVCTSCGASFERPRTRGRKPRLCPTCRGIAPVATDA